MADLARRGAPWRRRKALQPMPWVAVMVTLLLLPMMAVCFSFLPTLSTKNQPVARQHPLSWVRPLHEVVPSPTSLWASVVAEPSTEKQEEEEEEVEAVEGEDEEQPKSPKDIEKLEAMFSSLDAMKRTGEPPAKEMLLDAMWLAFRTRSWSRALEILHMPNVPPDMELYHLGLTTLQRGKFQYKRALSLLKEMEDLGLSPNVTSYNVAMQICADSQRVKDVVRLLDKMKIRSVKPALDSYNIAINSLARQSDWKKAVKLFEFMQKESVKPDVETFNAAIRACARAGAWQRALVLLEDMVKRGIVPTTGSYNAAMHACRVGGQRERAITFLEEMISKEIPVDTDSFSIIIAACDDPQLAPRAMEFVEKMVEMGIRPDLVTFGSLVTALGRQGDFTPALRILQEADKYKLTFSPSMGVMRLVNYALPKGGVTPEMAEYAMTVLVEEGKVIEAMGWLDRGVAAPIKGDDPKYKAMGLLNTIRQKVAGANAASSAGTTHLAHETLDSGSEDAEFKQITELCVANNVAGAVDALKDKDKLRSALSKMVMEYAVANKDYQAALDLVAIPNVRAGRMLYGRALHACALSRAWHEADELLHGMEEKGIVADDSIFLELIEGARMTGAFHKVTKYRAMMQERGVVPSLELCRSLMRAYVTVRRPGLALQIFRDCKERGTVDNDMVSMAMVAYKDIRQWQEADGLLKAAGASATDEMYGTVMRAMARAGHPDQAEDVFANQIPKDIRGADSLNALMQTRRKEGNLDGALSLLSEAESGKLGGSVVPNQYSYSGMMEALGEAGRHKEALEVFGRIKSPTLITYNLALCSLVALGQHQEAISTFKKMVEAKVPASDRTLQQAFMAAQALGFDSSTMTTLQALAA